MDDRVFYAASVHDEAQIEARCARRRDAIEFVTDQIEAFLRT
jgi:hypothetical protein